MESNASRFDNLSKDEKFIKWVELANLKLTLYKLTQETAKSRENDTIGIKVYRQLPESEPKLLVTCTIHENKSMSITPDQEELERGDLSMDVALIFSMVQANTIRGQGNNPTRALNELIYDAVQRRSKQN